MIEVKSYYEAEAAIYDKEFYNDDSKYPVLRFRHNYILKRIDEIKFPPNSKVLDVGCGPGEMVIDLSKQGWEVWGIDIAQNMIDIANTKIKRANIPNNKIHLATGDIESLALPENSFDLVICSGVIEYLNDDEQWSNEIVRVLKPGGILLINITNKHCIRNWTAGAIETLKKSRSFFKIMNFIKLRILRKGRLHHFPFRPRLHSPKAFDDFLASKGFEKLSHNYFGFYVLPAPFDTLFGFVTTPIRRRFEKYSEANMRLTGNGYIVCARLLKKESI